MRDEEKRVAAAKSNEDQQPAGDQGTNLRRAER